ncbi:hypothetical protein BO71DRAFT_253967 [Aspergillus ellipticus CBS 707.79]|uniref:Uncharacterized protein n=1 Tax=Aspergillus ellipticus CBS 707.79 TaxID=1448320 RepID=A0A319D8E9_9EURO|nr:hypothetical protein BO71DRAFT_253967 [Aspergillus ellipticus CBS 707.79]
MTNSLPNPLSRFRKHHQPPKPLHERWGDTDISVPTSGSWNQLDNPHRSTSSSSSSSSSISASALPPHPARRVTYTPTYAAPLPSRIHQHHYNEPPAPKPMNPGMDTSMSRRLSLRRPKPPTITEYPKENDRQTKAERRVSQFAYRPISQDYTLEVAETASSTAGGGGGAGGFRYIPTGGRGQRERVQSGYCDRRSRVTEDGSGYANGYGCDERRFSSMSSSSSSGSGSRRGFSSKRASPSAGRGLGMGIGGGERRGRRLTVDMVPDEEDIYG